MNASSSRLRATRRRALRATALVGAAAALAGCMVGPNYHTPDLRPPSAYDALTFDPKAAPLSATTGAPAGVEAWWSQFHDPTLDALVAQALKGNLDLQEARARIRQAREQEVVAGAAGLPQVNAMGNVLHLNRSASAADPLTSATGAGASGSAASSAATSAASTGLSHLDYYTAGFDATWEIDLFGGVRRSVESARALREAQVWRQRDTEVSLVAEVANDYLQYRLAQARLVVLHADQTRQEGLLKLVGDRFSTGFVSSVDVNQQRNQLASTQSQIPQAEAQAQTSLHALGVLLGEAPEALTASFAHIRAAAPPPVPPLLPVGLPSDLLQRRPDVRAAERQLASASAQIGVRTADLYPQVNLLALGTFGATDVSELFRGSNAVGAALGLVQWPLFAGGRNLANLRAARAAYDQAALEYRKTVLVAFQDVEDALSRYSAEQRRWSALKGSFTAAQNSYLIATQQYAVGLVDYTQVYQSEGALLSNQDQLTQSDAQLAVDVVAIYKALGGGWSLGERDPGSSSGVGGQADRSAQGQQQQGDDRRR